VLRFKQSAGNYITLCRGTENENESRYTESEIESRDTENENESRYTESEIESRDTESENESRGTES
jgi:hypothetical protein